MSVRADSPAITHFVLTYDKQLRAKTTKYASFTVVVTFRFDYQYALDSEYDFLAFELVMLTTRSSAVLVLNRRTATRYDYEYGFLSFELVMLTMRSSAILVLNRRTATRYDYE